MLHFEYYATVTHISSDPYPTLAYGPPPLTLSFPLSGESPIGDFLLLVVPLCLIIFIQRVRSVWPTVTIESDCVCVIGYTTLTLGTQTLVQSLQYYIRKSNNSE